MCGCRSPLLLSTHCVRETLPTNKIGWVGGLVDVCCFFSFGKDGSWVAWGR